MASGECIGFSHVSYVLLYSFCMTPAKIDFSNDIYVFLDQLYKIASKLVVVPLPFARH